jgi:ribonuclease HII
MNFKYEAKKMSQGFLVIGCDEVGRGCLAGPVVAAAVVLDLNKIKLFKGVDDSKVLSVRQRQLFDGIIREHCVAFGIGVVTEKVIDKINIHHASLLAMRKAVENLQKVVASETKNYLVAIDGKFIIPNFKIEQEAVVDGDAKILSIAAASVVAKVYRDSLMRRLHIKHPQYGFFAHKGYATFHHREAIKKYGLTPHHRLSFCGQYA